ncbi:hypothetical protein [Nocardioides sp. SYSU DS0651]|uniref:hypothetical protein n=1 Tax=Nocardioides sp. SYSU DS0651 TaxID=3415955 RepID=UPI003F4CA21D
MGSWTGPFADLDDAQVLSFSSRPAEGPGFGGNLALPAGQTFQAGQTYSVDAVASRSTPDSGRLRIWREGTMCGLTPDDVERLSGRYVAANPATGWVHVSEIEYDGAGRLVRFAATFEVNCQVVGGPPGFEGSIAANATHPLSPIPEAPATPSPVTDLKAKNVGPDSAGNNTTTLTWVNPTPDGDVTIDMVHSSNHALFPAVLAAAETKLYRGTASRYHDPHVEFMDTRTYRVVPRGATGRLGPPSLLTVMGTRLAFPMLTRRLTIGEEVTFTGRLSEAWDYTRPADVMKGPGLEGRTVLMCSQSSVDYVEGECTPVDKAVTTTDGHFSLTARPLANRYYRIVLPATAHMVGNSQYAVGALVAPRTDLRAPEAEPVGARARGVRRGSVIHFSTSRARAGSRGYVRLQRYDGDRWRTIKRKRLGTGSSRLAVPFREYRRGRHAYRIVKPGDSRHINGRSRTIHVRVR